MSGRVSPQQSPTLGGTGVFRPLSGHEAAARAASQRSPPEQRTLSNCSLQQPADIVVPCPGRRASLPGDLGGDDSFLRGATTGIAETPDRGDASLLARIRRAFSGDESFDLGATQSKDTPRGTPSSGNPSGSFGPPRPRGPAGQPAGSTAQMSPREQGRTASYQTVNASTSKQSSAAGLLNAAAGLIASAAAAVAMTPDPKRGSSSVPLPEHFAAPRERGVHDGAHAGGIDSVMARTPANVPAEALFREGHDMRTPRSARDPRSFAEGANLVSPSQGGSAGLSIRPQDVDVNPLSVPLSEETMLRNLRRCNSADLSQYFAGQLIRAAAEGHAPGSTMGGGPTGLDGLHIRSARDCTLRAPRRTSSCSSSDSGHSRESGPGQLHDDGSNFFLNKTLAARINAQTSKESALELQSRAISKQSLVSVGSCASVRKTSSFDLIEGAVHGALTPSQVVDLQQRQLLEARRLESVKRDLTRRHSISPASVKKTTGGFDSFIRPLISGSSAYRGSGEYPAGISLWSCQQFFGRVRINPFPRRKFLIPRQVVPLVKRF